MFIQYFIETSFWNLWKLFIIIHYYSFMSLPAAARLRRRPPVPAVAVRPWTHRTLGVQVPQEAALCMSIGFAAQGVDDCDPRTGEKTTTDLQNVAVQKRFVYQQTNDYWSRLRPPQKLSQVDYGPPKNSLSTLPRSDVIDAIIVGSPLSHFMYY